MSALDLPTFLYLLRDALAPYRDSGVDLSGSQITSICRGLAVAQVQAEQMQIMIGQTSPIVIDPADEKVVSILRYRSRTTSPPPPRPHPGGGSAA